MDEQFDAPTDELPPINDDDLLMPHEREMRDALMQMVAMLQQQNQLLLVVAKRLGPKRLMRDAKGRVSGVEPIEGL